MSAPHAKLAVVAHGGVPVAVDAPPVAGAAGAELREWTALQVGGVRVVGACVATPIPGWVEDMRTPVTARAHAWTAKLGERAAQSPVELRDVDESGVGSLHTVATAGASVGRARVLVGFEVGTEARVLTCGVACAAGTGPALDEDGRRLCETTVRASRLQGDTPPPPPGVALATVAWAVHHPSPTALGAGCVSAAALLALVMLRRRPRSRPWSARTRAPGPREAP